MPLFGPPNIGQLEAKRDVQGLIKALAFKDAAIRRAAAEALAPLKDPAAVEPLTALLDDESAGVRRAAVAALAARGGFRVVEPLVRALQDGDPETRSIAAVAVYRRLMTDADTETRRSTATALGRIRAVEGIEPLLKAIKDADESVRVAAIKALAAINDIEAVVPLVLVVAREESRARSTGRSDAAMERAASQALDVICDERAIEPLKAALTNDDTDVRETAVKRLARIGSPEVAGALTALLTDENPAIRRASARGLREMGWQPPADETGVRYWAALRQWRRCAECGAAAVPLLISSFDTVDSHERADVLSALAQLDWQPEEAGAMAAQYWASRGRWDKCVEIGELAVEALDAILHGAPKWRTRAQAAGALAAMSQPRTAPFARLDLVQAALAILDGEGEEADKRGLLEAFLVEEHRFDPDAEAVEFCKCGYPATKAPAGGSPQPMTDLLGFERNSAGATTYFCPSCDARRATVDD
jgi:HEAT repeat protein